MSEKAANGGVDVEGAREGVGDQREKVTGGIEILHQERVTWLRVREDEGLLLAIHNALDFFLEGDGENEVTVLKQTTEEARRLGHKKWEEVIVFRKK